MSAASRRTNWSVTLAALALLLPCFAFSDLIPMRDGIGYDGSYYKGWVANLSLDLLFEDVRVKRPRGVYITSYKIRRILVPIGLHYVFRGLGVAPTDANIVLGFQLLNLLCLVLATHWLCLCCDRLRFGRPAKWLGLVALLLNHANLKMAFFYPVLIDSAAVAVGAGLLLLYLRRSWTLVPAVLASGFVWPTFPYFGALLIAFPLREDRSVLPAPAPARLDRFVAGAAGLLGVGIVAGLLQSDHSIWTTPVEPIRILLPVSTALVAAHLYYGLRPLLDSRELWDDLLPTRLVRRPTAWIAGITLVLGELVIRTIPHSGDEMGSLRAVTDTFFTAITQPGINWVAHALHFGPLVLLLLFLWKPISESIRRCGTGIVLCFVLAVVLGVGSESRRLMNIYPMIVLFLAQPAAALLTTRASWAVVVALSVVFSKVWLPMSAPIEVPGVGEIPWRELFASSRGPWIDHTWWAVQAVAVLAVAAWFYSLYARPKISSTG